eukprot:c29596_g1_i1 orf=297-1607(-)
MLLKSNSTQMCSFSPCVAHYDTLKEVDFHCYSASIHGFVPRTVSCHHGCMTPTQRSLTALAARHYLLEVEDSTGVASEIDILPAAGPGLRRALSEGDLASLNNGPTRKKVVSSFFNSSNEGAENFGGNYSSPNRHWRRRMGYTGSYNASNSSIFGTERRDFLLKDRDISATGQGDHKLNDDMHAEGGQGTFAEFLRVDTSFADSERESTESFHKDNHDSKGQTGIAAEYRRSTGTFGMKDVNTSMSVDKNGTPAAYDGRGCRSFSESKKLSPSIGSGMGLAMEGGHFGGGDNSGATMLGFEADQNNTEAYYRKWLQDDPENTLLLRNFATFLYEVKNDHKGAEEFYERAIRASPTDGETLSQYAKLVWDVHRDENRAETYFSKAVQAAPDDCYVLGSYASFLWDSEDSEQSNNPSSPLDTDSTPLIHETPRLVASA